MDSSEGDELRTAKSLAAVIERAASMRRWRILPAAPLLDTVATASLPSKLGRSKAGLMGRYVLAGAALSYATRRRVGLMISPLATASK